MRGKPVFARLMGVGLLKPKIKIPGGDIAGVIESVGKNVRRFQPGDKVFGNHGRVWRRRFRRICCRA